MLEEEYIELDPSKQQKKRRKHQCKPLSNFDVGSLIDLSDHNQIKYIPTKLEKFKFREKDMSKLIKSLLDSKERIIPLLGLHGIGKSALARNTLHYVAERKMFSGGVLFIKLKNIRSSFAVVKNIMRNIMRYVDFKTGEKQM